MGDDAVAGKQPAGVVGTGLDIDDGAACFADDEIGRAGARRSRHRLDRILAAFGVQHLPAAHVERRSVGIAAVVARCEPVLDQGDATLVHAHLAARDAGLGQADEARTVAAPSFQHQGSPVHALEPIPVLAEPGMAIGGRLGCEAECGAAVGPYRQQPALLPLGRFLSEQGEGELIARIEKRNDHVVLAGAFGNSPHFLGIGDALGGDRVAPARGLGQGLVAAQSGERETAKVGVDVAGDLLREPPSVGEPARVRVAFDGQQWNAGHCPPNPDPDAGRCRPIYIAAPRPDNEGGTSCRP